MKGHASNVKQHVELTNRELATVLAALRYWQLGMEEFGGPPLVSHFEEHAPLFYEEVDILCERLNTSD